MWLPASYAYPIASILCVAFIVLVFIVVSFTNISIFLLLFYIYKSFFLSFCILLKISKKVYIFFVFFILLHNTNHSTNSTRHRSSAIVLPNSIHSIHKYILSKIVFPIVVFCIFFHILSVFWRSSMDPIQLLFGLRIGNIDRLAIHSVHLSWMKI